MKDPEIQSLLDKTPPVSPEMIERLKAASENKISREELLGAVNTIRTFASQNDEGVSIVGAYGILSCRLHAVGENLEPLREAEKHLRFLCDNLIDDETAAHAVTSEVCDNAARAIGAIERILAKE